MRLLDKLFSGNTLYYPGCLTKFVAKDLKSRYEKILRKAGIDFIILSDLEACCGSPVLNAGFEEEFKKLAEKNLRIFKDHGISKIITNCPACYKVLSKDYPKFLGKRWDIKVEHISQTITNLKPQTSNFKLQKGVITYHDPCHLGRQMGVYDEPREIIKNAGYEIKEMKLNRDLSFCCGAGGGLKANNPDLANKIAKKRIAQAKETKAKCLITSCPLCYLNLKENTKDLKVKELSEILEET